MAKLKLIVQEKKPSKIICVGDKISETMVKHNFNVQLFIVDGRIMRRSAILQDFQVDEVLHVKNPTGVITEEAFDIVVDAAKSNRRIRVVVDGEEDLLAIPAVLGAPENAFVVYGQPHEGVVVIQVTMDIKKLTREIFDEMEVVDSKN